MVICCIQETQILLTIEPIAKALGLHKNQLVILASTVIVRRRVAEQVVRYAVFCKNEKELTNVLELVSHMNTIRLNNVPLEISSYTIVSINGGTTGNNISRDSNVNGIMDHMPFWNFALIVVLCFLLSLLYAYHRHHRNKSRRLAAHLSRSVVMQMSPLAAPGKFTSEGCEDHETRVEVGDHQARL